MLTALCSLSLTLINMVTFSWSWRTTRWVWSLYCGSSNNQQDKILRKHMMSLSWDNWKNVSAKIYIHYVHLQSNHSTIITLTRLESQLASSLTVLDFSLISPTSHLSYSCCVDMCVSFHLQSPQTSKKKQDKTLCLKNAGELKSLGTTGQWKQMSVSRLRTGEPAEVVITCNLWLLFHTWRSLKTSVQLRSCLRFSGVKE